MQQLREDHETFQKLTSQLQQMQEQINSLNDSGEFPDVESNYSGWFSRFQSICVDSEFSFRAQPLQKIGARYVESICVTGKTFSEIIFLRLIYPEIVTSNP